MATALTELRITNNSTNPIVVPGAKGPTVQALINAFRSFLAGPPSTVSMQVGYNAVSATGTVTIESGSGSIVATINGVASTVTWGTSDTATAVLLAAKINAGGDTPNNLVSKQVSATSALGVVTITSKIPGFAGNAVTLAASGTGATASGARLTGGTETQETLTFP